MHCRAANVLHLLAAVNFWKMLRNSRSIGSRLVQPDAISAFGGYSGPLLGFGGTPRTPWGVPPATLVDLGRLRGPFWKAKPSKSAGLFAQSEVWAWWRKTQNIDLEHTLIGFGPIRGAAAKCPCGLEGSRLGFPPRRRANFEK